MSGNQGTHMHSSRSSADSVAGREPFRSLFRFTAVAAGACAGCTPCGVRATAWALSAKSRATAHQVPRLPCIIVQSSSAVNFRPNFVKLRPNFATKKILVP